LDRFRAGYVYAVGTTLGCYLLAIGAAEPVSDDEAALTLPPEQQLFGPIALGRSYRPVAPNRPISVSKPAPIRRPSPRVRPALPIAEAADREAPKKAAPRARAAKRPSRKHRR
jgi:hypothetical protein